MLENSHKEVISLNSKTPLISADIELMLNSDGRWMWAFSWFYKTTGHCFSCAEKWGLFASSRQEALTNAIRDVRMELNSSFSEACSEISDWLDSLVMPFQQSLFD